MGFPVFNHIMDILFLLVGVLTLFYLLLKRTYSYWGRRGVPTLPGAFSQRANFGERLKELYAKTDKPYIGMYGILRPMLLIRDPDLIQSILVRDFEYFTDHGIHSSDDFNSSLFALKGPKWTDMRAKLSPAFTSEKIRAISSTLINCCSKVENNLEKLSQNGELFDVHEFSTNLITNIISSVAFGIQVDSNSNFQACKLIQDSFWNGFKSVIIRPRLLSCIRIKSIYFDAEEFIKSVVKHNLEYREKNNVSRQDFFQLLIELRNIGSVQPDDNLQIENQVEESKPKLTLNEMAAQIHLFCVAGVETSATLITFFMYEMAKNQDIQIKLHEEIDRVSKLYDGKITYESLADMKYLDCCIDETLRKYPVMPFLTRSCVKEYRIPGTETIIEKNVDVLIPVLALHHDSKYFPEPEIFDPDRFSADNSADKNQTARPYLPFGGGPRRCIGLRLGKLQTKIALVLMLQKFNYKLEDDLGGKEMKFNPSTFLLAPIDGLKLHISKRQHC